MKYHTCYLAVFLNSARYKVIIGFDIKPYSLASGKAIILESIASRYHMGPIDRSNWCREVYYPSSIGPEWVEYIERRSTTSSWKLPHSIEKLMVHPDILIIDSNENRITNLKQLKKHW